MKAIVNGRRYNTETATLVGSWSYGTYQDFSYIEEQLYITERGSWFIAGEGGPKTKYSIHVEQNAWGGSERITPLSPDEARRWLEAAEEWDALETWFGDSLEDA